MAQPHSPGILRLTAAALLAAGLACNAVSGLTSGGETTATPRPTRTPETDPTEAEEPTEAPEEATPRPTRTPRPTAEDPPTEAVEIDGGVLFADDFSDPGSGWGEAEDETALREYRDGAYVIEILDTGWLIWANPHAGPLSNTHTTAIVTNVGAAQDAAFGLICHYADDSAFYYFGAGADGYYAIVRAEGDDDVFLTSDEGLWEFSEDIEVNAGEYVIEAICAADGTLTLIVNGIEIASVQDDVYTEGDVGVFALSFEEIPVEVHFDDLSVVPAAE